MYQHLFIYMFRLVVMATISAIRIMHAISIVIGCNFEDFIHITVLSSKIDIQCFLRIDTRDL